MKKAHIITIGNELLIGDTINTNAAQIGGMLTELGFSVEQVVTIPDRYRLIMDHLAGSFESADLTIVTGGLGPTHDDITKKAVADFFRVSLVEDAGVRKHIRSMFERRGFEFSRANADQARVPSNCEVLFNNKGTAPGMWFEEQGRALAVLPGVPYEMQYLMEKRVKPKIKKLFPGSEQRAVHYFKTAGVPESTLSEQIGDLSRYLKNGVEAAYLPAPGGVIIRISASDADRNKAEQKLSKIRKRLYERAGGVIYAEGKESHLAEVVGRILEEKNLTIAVAESCTGGLIANTLTDIPGSSNYVKGGIVAYSNDMKIKLLRVEQQTLREHGAVSCETALQMAKGAAEQCGANVGVSATGIAGPGGGSPEKPVGTVWMGFWIFGHHFALKAVFSNDRQINKERTVMVVLETVRRQLLELDGFPYHLKPHLP